VLLKIYIYNGESIFRKHFETLNMSDGTQIEVFDNLLLSPLKLFVDNNSIGQTTSIEAYEIQICFLLRKSLNVILWYEFFAYICDFDF